MLSADRDRLSERLAHIAGMVTAIRERVPDEGAFSRLARDSFALDGLVYRLQTAIQSMIDVAFQLSAKEFTRAPENAAQAFEILETERLIPPELMARIRRMVRFRNLVVHGYLRRDDAIIKEIALKHLADFSAFIRVIAENLPGESER